MFSKKSYMNLLYCTGRQIPAFWLIGVLFLNFKTVSSLNNFCYEQKTSRLDILILITDLKLVASSGFPPRSKLKYTTFLRMVLKQY